ncbi:MAG: carboxylesterase family protein [Myxococcaceae bacterium]|nr:carboxylesterase family protein [Myxococcaceae bacterium]
MRFIAMCAAVCAAACSPTPTPNPPLDSGTLPDAGGTNDAGNTPRCGDGITPDAGIAFTTTGAVLGTTTGDVTRWLGIPYARAPRFRPPEPQPCWPDLKATTSFGPRCPQLDDDGGTVLGAEECLTLNVWSKRPTSPAPILFFIHGGGNTVGSSSEPYADGHDLADRHGAVVVTINYRLGALGFFAHAQLNAESDAGVSGNWGILDQQLALRWVRDNAAAFGGDPTRVLVFGESAGAQNTMIHLVSPASKGLFTAALVESGGAYKTTLAETITQQQAVVAGAGCGSAADPLACMRAAPVDTLVRVPTAIGPLERGVRYGPNVDGVVVPGQVEELISQGRHNHVPFIIGTNSDETSRMVPAVPDEMAYQQAVRAQFGLALGNQVLAQYPASRFTTPRQALIAVTTDAVWTCSSRRIARKVAANQTEPTFRYFFTWRPPGLAGTAFGATHGLELAFVFRSFSAFGAYVPDATASTLSDHVQSYWSNLAGGGDPNGGAAPTWPRFPTDGGENAMELGATTQALPGVRSADCDFWDALMP